MTLEVTTPYCIPCGKLVSILKHTISYVDGDLLIDICCHGESMRIAIPKEDHENMDAYTPEPVFGE
jgi:hypothetical protein